MFSKLLRRTHMYLALFLAPWVVAYALSTIVMQHSWFQPAVFVFEREQPYDASFPEGTTPQVIGAQVLSDLGMDGAFAVQGPGPNGALTINWQHLVSPRRITYAPAAHSLKIERVGFQPGNFLNRFHHRRGYQQPFAADQLFAVSIDVVIVAMVLWALSGLWMWWEMRATRRWGMLSLVAGLAVFVGLVVGL